MTGLADQKDNRRRYKRFEVLIQIRYFLYHSSYPQDGLLIDVSKHGACIKIQQESNLSIKGMVLLEVLTTDCNNINIRAEIAWLKKTEEGFFVVGVKFIKPLDDATFHSISRSSETARQ